MITMIRLLKTTGEVLYEKALSERFPNYISVLHDAIEKKVNLSGIKIQGQILDDLEWKEVKSDHLVLSHCSLKNNRFINCTLNNFFVRNCQGEKIKFKYCSIQDSEFVDSNFVKSQFRHCSIENTLALDSDFSDSIFQGNKCRFLSFNTVNLQKAIFEKTSFFKTSFINNNHLMQDVSFMECTLDECDMAFLNSLSTLLLWRTDMQKVAFRKDQRFTEVRNLYSEVYYAIDSDIVWWKIYPNQSNGDGGSPVYRCCLTEFLSDIANGFPKKPIEPEYGDEFLYEELQNVGDYFKSWRS